MIDVTKLDWDNPNVVTDENPPRAGKVNEIDGELYYIPPEYTSGGDLGKLAVDNKQNFIMITAVTKDGKKSYPIRGISWTKFYTRDGSFAIDGVLYPYEMEDVTKIEANKILIVDSTFDTITTLTEVEVHPPINVHDDDQVTFAAKEELRLKKQPA